MSEGRRFADQFAASSEPALCRHFRRLDHARSGKPRSASSQPAGNPAAAVETSLRYDVPGHPTPRTQTIPVIHQTAIERQDLPLT